MSVDNVTSEVLNRTAEQPVSSSTTSSVVKGVSELKVGETYQAQVIKQVTSQGEQEGILVDQEFHQVDLPENVANGANVKIKVVALQPELKVEILKVEQVQKDSLPQTTVQKQLDQLLKSIIQARSVSQLQEIPKEIFQLITKTENGFNSINLEQIGKLPEQILAALKNMSQVEINNNKEFNRNIEGIIKQQQQVEKIQVELEKMLAKFEVNKEVGVIKQDSIQAKELLRGLQQQVDNVVHTSEEVTQFLHKLETSTPEALLLQNVKRLTLLKKLPEYFQQPAAELIKIFEPADGKVVDKEILQRGKEIAELILRDLNQTIDSKNLPIKDNPKSEASSELRQLRIQVLSIKAHINNLELTRTDSEITKEQQETVLTQLTSLKNSPGDKQSIEINPILVDSLKQLAQSAAKDNGYSKALIEYIRLQVSGAADTQPLIESYNKILNGNSVELIKHSLEAIQKEVVTQGSAFPEEIKKFVEQMLSQLNELYSKPIIIRSLQFQHLLQNILDKSIKFLDQLNSAQLPQEPVSAESSYKPAVAQKIMQLADLTKTVLAELEHSLEGIFAPHEEKLLGQLDKVSGRLLKAIEKLVPELKNETSPQAMQLKQTLEKFAKDWQRLITERADQSKFQNLIVNLQSAINQELNPTTNINIQVANSKQLDSALIKKIEAHFSRIFVATQSLLNEGSELNIANTLLDLKANNKSALPVFLNLINNFINNHSNNELIGDKSALLNFVNLMKQLEHDSRSVNTELRSAVTNTLEHFTNELESAEQLPPKKQRELLLKIAGHLKNELTQASDQSSKNNTDSLLKTINNMETMLRGQESLLQMLPILKATNEPVFLIFPMLIQGFMSKLELVHYPGYFTNTGYKNEKQNKRNNTEPKRTILNLQLPQLGKIKVDLLHSPEQVQCKFVLENGLVVDRFTQQLPMLKRALEKAGFQNIDCQARAGKGTMHTEIDFKIIRRPSVVA